MPALGHFDKEDLPDADVWITKATLLGLPFSRFEDRPNGSKWACGYLYNSIWFYGDHPGRAAKHVVEVIMERTHDDP